MDHITSLDLLILYIFLTLFFTIYKVIEKLNDESEKGIKGPETFIQHILLYLIAMPLHVLKGYLQIHLVMIPIFVIIGIIYLVFS